MITMLEASGRPRSKRIGAVATNRMPFPDAPVLMIDDDESLTRLVQENLAVLGIALETTHTGEDGLEQLRTGQFALVILDVMLPVMSGFEVLIHLRQFSDVPVIMLTGRCDPLDMALGFQMGSDDYIAKPFSWQELALRVSAILRRAQRRGNDAVPVAVLPASGHVIRVGETDLDPVSRRVLQAGAPVFLTAAEFDALHLLFSPCGSIRSREELCRAAFGRELGLGDRSVDNLMVTLRKKLHHGAAPAPINAVRHKGYFFSNPASPQG